MTIKLETKHIRNVAIFENITGVAALDCIIDSDTIYFVVKKEDVGMAIGKNGIIINMVKKTLSKNVVIIPYSNNPKEFIKNMLQGINIKNIEINNGVLMLNIPRSHIANVVGKRGRNIKIYRELLNRHFNIKDIRIR